MSILYPKVQVNPHPAHLPVAALDNGDALHQYCQMFLWHIRKPKGVQSWYKKNTKPKNLTYTAQMYKEFKPYPPSLIFWWRQYLCVLPAYV